jgi:hypothetical protein
MIPFFRKIRKQFADDNKPIKYMRYAIGEIVLVVIGILIALSINNWNNKRIEHKIEKQFLSEIVINLKDDYKQVQKVLDFNKTKDSVIIETMQLMSRASNLERRTKISSLLPTLAEYEVFLPNRVAFDNMTSSFSINLISNDSLRQILSSYYKNTLHLTDFTQEQIKDQTRKFVDESITLLVDDDLVKKLTGLDIKINQLEDFYTNPRTFKNLFNMRMNMVSQNNLLDYIKKQIDLILLKIKQEN